jgi:hypothetical protein
MPDRPNPPDTLTDAEVDALQKRVDAYMTGYLPSATTEAWEAAEQAIRLMEMGAVQNTVRLVAALRQARGMVEALAFHTCEDGDFYICPECHASYGQGGLKPTHAPDCAWDAALRAMAAWRGEDR